MAKVQGSSVNQPDVQIEFHSSEEVKDSSYAVCTNHHVKWPNHVAGKVGEHTHHELAFYGQEMEGAMLLLR
jgi:hypothetical protein